MDIFGDASMLTYLQIGELNVGLTSKENDWIVKGQQYSIGKANTFLKYGPMGVYEWNHDRKCKKPLWNMPIRNWDIFRFVRPTICFKANIGGKPCIWKFNNLFHDA